MKTQPETKLLISRFQRVWSENHSFPTFDFAFFFHIEPLPLLFQHPKVRGRVLRTISLEINGILHFVAQTRAAYEETFTAFRNTSMQEA